MAHEFNVKHGFTINNQYVATGITNVSALTYSDRLVTEEAIKRYVDAQVATESFWNQVGNVIQPSSAGTSLDMGTGSITGTSLHTDTLNLFYGVTVSGISNTTGLTENSDVYLPTQKAVKAYVDAQISSENYWDRVGTVITPQTSSDTVAVNVLNVTGNTTLYGLTANQVVYTDASKVLTTSANLTFDGTTLTALNANVTSLTGATFTSTTSNIATANITTINSSVINNSSTLKVTGATTLYNTLSVFGATNIYNTLTISGNTTPSINNAFDLGSISNRWRNIYGVNLNIEGNATIVGDLFVSGTTTYINTTNMNIGDNIITINSGQTGSGVTLVNAGIKVDRGTAAPYYFIFNEDSDTFRIGSSSAPETSTLVISGDTQAVATRQDADTIVANGISYWNNVASRFDTSANFKWNSGLFVTGVTNINGVLSLPLLAGSQTTLLGVDSTGQLVTASGYIYKSSVTGATTTQTVDTFAATLGQGVVWDYVVIESTSGLTKRAGTITASWNTSTSATTWNESTTPDLNGVTTSVDFTVTTSGTNIILATAISSGSWNVYADRKIIG